MIYFIIGSEVTAFNIEDANLWKIFIISNIDKNWKNKAKPI